MESNKMTKNKKIIWGSLVCIFVCLLLEGGVYFPGEENMNLSHIRDLTTPVLLGVVLLCMYGMKRIKNRIKEEYSREFLLFIFVAVNCIFIWFHMLTKYPGRVEFFVSGEKMVLPPTLAMVLLVIELCCLVYYETNEDIEPIEWFELVCWMVTVGVVAYSCAGWMVNRWVFLVGVVLFSPFLFHAIERSNGKKNAVVVCGILLLIALDVFYGLFFNISARLPEYGSAVNILKGRGVMHGNIYAVVLAVLFILTGLGIRDVKEEYQRMAIVLYMYLVIRNVLHLLYIFKLMPPVDWIVYGIGDYNSIDVCVTGMLLGLADEKSEEKDDVEMDGKVRLIEKE